MIGMRIVLGNGSLARYPQGGGHWMIRLQYLFGLRALGQEIFLLECLYSNGNTNQDQQLIAAFFQRLEEFGLNHNAALLLFQTDWTHQDMKAATAYGKTKQEIISIIQSADVLWNDCGHIRQPLLGMFQRRVFIDLDPGCLQVASLSVNTDVRHHHAFLTVGTKLQDSDCEVPTLGLKWQPFLPFVYMPWWKPAPDPGPNAPFTSVTHWGWGALKWGDRTLSTSKRKGYLKYLELPQKARRPLELAANLHKDGPEADDTGDIQRLLAHEWRIVDPWKITPSPAAYQAYISNSRAELSCPKPIYTELKTGWVSDRSVCYLASGRPVLAEDTGLSDHLPTGKGLLVFRNMSEALEGIAEIDSHYSEHLKSAREIAEEFMDSQKCLSAMLEASG